LKELSLAFFDAGENKDPTRLMQQLWTQSFPHCSYTPTEHFHASWWHLSGYGPRYYAYLWSQVYAFDLFQKIRKEGLLNPISGSNYIQTILKWGGGKDPNQLLADFLGREPTPSYFLQTLESSGL